MRAIKVSNLTKIYHLYDSPTARLKEALHPLRKKYHHDFYALNKVSFEVKEGEVLGIIGKNGSGKSTLLKILAGVLTQTSGTVTVNGSVSALLELGGGFNPEFTGLENVYFSSAIMGYTREQVEKNLDAIVAFADIGEFIHQPVKTYSSGMYVRLAFAVAINVDPDVLIVDEALSVGDIRFQQKCFRKIKAFKESGKSIIFVTHDTGAVINFCNRAIWIDDGKIMHESSPDDTVKRYVAYMAYDAAIEESKTSSVSDNSPIRSESEKRGALKLDELEWQDVSKCSSFGEGGVEVSRVAFYLQESFDPVVLLKGGEKVIFFAEVLAKAELLSPGIGLRCNDTYGNNIFTITSYIDGFIIPPLHENEDIIVKITFDFPKILNGYYTLTVAIADGTQLHHVQHHYVHDVYFIQVTRNDLRYTMGYLVMDEAGFEVIPKHRNG